MSYLHIKNIKRYHSSYKDRNVNWVKVYLEMLSSPEFSCITEIDKWRFVAFVLLEIENKKEVFMEESYLVLKGFDFTQRGLDATLTALTPFINLVDEPSLEGTVLKRIIKPKSEKDVQLNKDCKKLFDYWNRQGVIIHRDYQKYYPCIKGRLEKYSLEELKEAITNYATVLHGKEYFWTYKWTIDEFLVRKGGLDKFLKENFDINTYRAKKTLEGKIDEQLKGLEGFENENL